MLLTFVIRRGRDRIPVFNFQCK